MKIEFNELRELVEDYYADERNANVKLGCDCGCGGDSFTLESWKQMCDDSDKAKKRLKELGVWFIEDSIES